MDVSNFRKWAHRAADWSADYLENVGERPVRAQTKPGDIAGKLPVAPPEKGEDMAQIFEDVDRLLMPGMTHWQHPRFFAYFPANSSPPSVIAEYLTAAMAAQCMLWQTSPAATELETHVLGWLRQLLNLPESFQGVIQDSASSATLAAVLTGRERALGFRGNLDGLAAHPPVRVYCSEQAHSSIDKAIWIAGIGEANLVKVATGDGDALDAEALEQAIRVDRAAGGCPAVLVATIGSTSIGAMDDLRAIGEVARRHDLYFHVDAAWAGSALICEEHRHLIGGIEAADSFVFNPHKWLFTNFDCTAHFVKDPNALVKTLGIQPDYLKTQGEGGIDYSEWSIPLGRRFRALKLWFVIRSYGVERLQEIIQNHIRMAETLAQKVDAHPDFELTTNPSLSLFTFRYAPPGADDLDDLNARLLQAINDDGRIYLTQTSHQGAYVIRFQVGQLYTTEEDVEMAWTVIKQLVGGLSNANGGHSR
ncbi:MAG: pyridoxal-dependent decarboxylase [Alphaproteobacteria bacterium]|nr:pyridoxal-dependent decarboxylase [Alphaproteobacteria bacterium]